MSIQFHSKGFTLIEMMLYVAFLAMLIGAVGAFLFWGLRTGKSIEAESEAVFQADRAKEIMTKEIQEAQSVYTPTSVFGAHPGQFSLETLKSLPTGETKTFVDFFLCETRLCIKRESQNPVALTSDRVLVENFVARQIVTGTIPSLKIDMKISGVPLAFTVSLRSYAE